MNVRRGFSRLWWAFSVPGMAFWPWHDDSAQIWALSGG